MGTNFGDGNFGYCPGNPKRDGEGYFLKFAAVVALAAAIIGGGLVLLGVIPW